MVWLCLLPPSVARKHACTALSVCLVQPLCPLLVDEPGRGAWGLTIAWVAGGSLVHWGGRKWNASPTTHWEASFQLALKGDDTQRTTTASSNRKCSREKEIWETEKDENSQKGTKQQTHRHYSETVTCKGLLPLRHFGAQSKYTLVKRHNLGYFWMVILWLIFIFIFILFLHFPSIFSYNENVLY